jgi:hypothetical protein
MKALNDLFGSGANQNGAAPFTFYTCLVSIDVGRSGSPYGIFM